MFESVVAEELEDETNELTNMSFYMFTNKSLQFYSTSF